MAATGCCFAVMKTGTICKVNLLLSHSTLQQAAQTQFAGCFTHLLSSAASKSCRLLVAPISTLRRLAAPRCCCCCCPKPPPAPPLPAPLLLLLLPPPATLLLSKPSISLSSTPSSLLLASCMSGRSLLPARLSSSSRKITQPPSASHALNSCRRRKFRWRVRMKVAYYVSSTEQPPIAPHTSNSCKESTALGQHDMLRFGLLQCRRCRSRLAPCTTSTAAQSGSSGLQHMQS